MGRTLDVVLFVKTLHDLIMTSEWNAMEYVELT